MGDALYTSAPQYWRRAKLAEICVNEAGIQTGPFGSQLHASDYVSSGIPSVMPQNIGDNKISAEGIARISEFDANRLAKYRLKAGDIVYSRRGDVERRALVRNNEDGWLCGTGCLRVRPGDDVDSTFLSYYLGHPESKTWVVQHAIGATMPNLNTGILSELPVVLPPAAEQHAIAEVLGALDDKIAANEAVSITSEQLMMARFASIECDVESPDSIHSVAELVDFNPRQRRLPQRDVPYVDMAALPTRTARIKSWTMREPKSGARFQNGDTLLAKITPCLENGKTGFVDFLENDEIGTGSTEFIVMRSREGVPVHFPYFLARSPRFRQHAVSNMVGSSGRQRCPTQPLEEHPIQLPDEETLAEFGTSASKFFDLIRSLDAESRTLAALRDALLPELISGRLRVKDAEKQVSDVV